MRKLLILLCFLSTNTFLYSQEKVILSHAIKPYDFIEISLELDNKPSDKFHLVKIDSIVTITNKDENLKNNHDAENIFRRGNVLMRYEVPSKKFKTLEIKGTLKYFIASEDNKSYFKLGKLKNLKKNTNLIDATLANKNALYFSIADSTAINKAFPDFKFRTDDKSAYKKIDFKFYDLILAYKSSKAQDFLVVVNDEVQFGYNNLTLTEAKTGIVYKLIKLKREMPKAERDEITIELLIENEDSIKIVPFEFNNVVVKEY